MLLHNPPNLKLPALKINKLDSREMLEKSPNIMSIISSNLLLESEFHELIIDINKKSELISSSINMLAPTDPFEDLPMSFFYSKPITRKQAEALEHLFVLRSKKKDKSKNKEIEKIVAEWTRDSFKKIISNMKRKSTEIQRRLAEYEKEKGKILDILTTDTLYLCKNCHSLLTKNRFKHSECRCGKKVASPSSTRIEPISYFDKNMRSFIDNNYWFEYGVDYLLRRKGYQTLCGYHVLGHSGNWHEIDNIAENNSTNYRIFCECKTGEIKVNDVLILAGKMSDIGCTRGFILTLSAAVQKEIQYLARSRNIYIACDVHNKSIKALMDEIKE